ncbi:hypothetical protein CLU79DRAFT_778756 [Phycomyces nitens]|nr:hypothetical protein CLU79DRAFT_778756 [Phycomyces nitens]
MINSHTESSSFSASSSYVEENGEVIHRSSNFQSSHSQSTTLTIVAHGASELISVETMGKQDPFLQFSLDYSNAKSYQKTFTHKKAGAEATWNQTFVLPLSGQPDLYIEVMDEESTFAEVIGFAAIPINQVVHAQSATFNGIFDIFAVNGKRAGQVHLTLSAQGFPNSASQQFEQQVVRGQSYVKEEHLKRVKTLKNKALGTDIAMGVLGGALAIGAGFLGKKTYSDHQKAEEERVQQEAQEQEEEAKRVEERETFEREKREFEEQKVASEAERQEREESYRVQQTNTRREESESHQSTERHNESSERRESSKSKSKSKKSDERRNRDSGSGSDSDSDSSDSDSGSGSDEEKRCRRKEKKEKREKKKCERKEKRNSSCDRKEKRDNSCDRKEKRGGKEWDPVGTYSTGDRVKYHGHNYICLQGHSSNPTWKPDVAHSLWESA